MIQAVDLRSGMRFIDSSGNLMEVIEAEHHKPGKGNTVMRMKIKNIRTGATTETTYRPDDKFERAYFEEKPVQYLYSENNVGYFMDLETYEQYEIPLDLVEEEMKFVKENMQVEISFYDGEVMGIVLPPSVELKITETTPNIKGASVTGTGKPATLETGLVVNVPDFVEQGEVIEVSTSNGGAYKGRV